MSGTHVCLRRVDPPLVFQLISRERVTHMCGAPTVLTMLIQTAPAQRTTFEQVVELETGGSSPPAKVIRAMSEMGFNVTHLYGLTEVHGPSTLCAPQEAWETLGLAERAEKVARQGVRYPTLDGQMVADPKTLRPVPAESGAVQIAVRYISATSRATVGGDLYEVVAAADATRFIIGDVQGKGLEAVKMETTLYAERPGKVAEVLVRPGKGSPPLGEQRLCALVRARIDDDDFRGPTRLRVDAR